MSVWTIILAAGQGSRLAQAGLDTKKQFLHHEGAPLYWKSVRTLASVPAIKGFVFVFPPEELDACTKDVESLSSTDDLSMPCLCVAGGARRQDSVFSGLQALPKACSKVLVHDSARPFASAKLAQALISALEHGAEAAIPGLPVTDTIKVIDQDDTVTQTLNRSELRAVQTPQAFDTAALIHAHLACEKKQLSVTDDASMIEATGGAVRIVPGEAGNIKITTPEDLSMLNAQAPQTMLPCVGWGYDVHRYGAGRPFRLGGIPVDTDIEVIAHSDGDVLLHALADALLGCLGLGDIGKHFPDTDAKFEGIESSILVNEVLQEVEKKALTITHVDLTVIAQRPKLASYRERIQKNVANLLRIDKSHVNFKATTEEKLGFTGAKKGIKAVACVSAVYPANQQA